MPTVSELLSQNVGNTITNSQTWNGVIYNVKAYGAKGDGSTDDASKIADAITAASTNGGIVYFPPGTYVVGSAITFPSNVTAEFSNGAKLSINSGITVTINGPIHAGLYHIFSGAGTVAGNIKVLYVVPQWWGAKGDGVTDDTISIQKSINAVFAIGNGVVFLSKGEYKITDTIILKGNVTIKGEGRKASIIAPATTDQTVFSLTYTTLTRAYVEISNLGIVAKASGTKAIVTTLASALSFYDLYIAGTVETFHIDRGSNFQIKSILVEGTTYYKAGKAIFESTDNLDHIFDAQITDYQIRNIGNGVETPSIKFHRAVACHVFGYHVNDLYQGGTPADGILFSDDCQGCKIISSIIVKPGAYGIKFIKPTTTPAPSFTTIMNVDIDQSQGTGIQIDAGNWGTVVGGNITGCTTRGIEIGDQNNNIIGVTIKKCGQQGIQVNAGVTNFKIIDCHIESTTTAILVSAGASDKYYIVGNHVATGNTNTVIDNGTGIIKVVKDNIGVTEYKKQFAASTINNLVGGAATESINVAIPAGIFSNKPQAGFLLVSSPVADQIIGFYDFDNVNSTANNAVFSITRRDGATLTAGNRRFSVLLIG